MTTGGVVNRFPLSSDDAVPGRIVAGPDGNLWFTEFTGFNGREFRIGRLSTSGVLTEFNVPRPAAGLSGLAVGPDGNIWFTEFWNDTIGKITTSGAITEYAFPYLPLYPSYIAAGPDGNLWFLTEDPSIGRMTTSGTLLSEYPIPQVHYETDLTVGPDGNFWFLESPRLAGCCGKIARMTLSGDVREYVLPDASARPYGLTAGPDGNLWFMEGGAFPSRIGRITTSGFITEFEDPYGMPDGMTTGPDGNLWIVQGQDKSIVRFSPPPPIDLWLTVGRFRVNVTWEAAASGEAGSGQAVSLTPNTGAFWFFDPTNLEVVVKVLDGRSINGKFWVFYGSLTNVEFTLTVTDTQTGAVKAYFNPQGQLASVADTSAF